MRCRTLSDRARRADPHQLRVDPRRGHVRVDPDLDFTEGVAITSSFHPTPDTHIEPVRYGKGSNAMGAAADPDDRRRRAHAALDQVPRSGGEESAQDAADASVRNWSERTIIALVMQNLDNSITTYTKKGLFGRRKVTSKQGHGQPNPTWIPAGQRGDPPHRGEDRGRRRGYVG